MVYIDNNIMVSNLVRAANPPVSRPAQQLPVTVSAQWQQLPPRLICIKISLQLQQAHNNISNSLKCSAPPQLPQPGPTDSSRPAAVSLLYLSVVPVPLPPPIATLHTHRNRRQVAIQFIIYIQYTSPMIINKITPFIYWNIWLKSFDTKSTQIFWANE